MTCFILNILFLDPIKSTAQDQPPEERLKGSQSSLPSYNEATSGQFSNHAKNNSENSEAAGRKKIIPVQSDFESSSPSPDPLQTPPSSQSPVPGIRTSVRTSQSSFNLARAQEPEVSRKTVNKLVISSHIDKSLFIPDKKEFT